MNHPDPMSYSAFDRARMVEILRGALTRLWSGHDSDSAKKQRYICHAITTAYRGTRHENMVRNLILERLDGRHSVENWLHDTLGYSVSDYTVRVQKYRRAWIRELIREFKV